MTSKKNIERDEGITLSVLSAVESDSRVTQRSLSSDLGVALGLTNAFLKKCVDKGLIKINQIPVNRYSYYLTPHGFAEKTRLTAKYLNHSFSFYRRAKSECSLLLEECYKNGQNNILLSDYSEFAEIVIIVALSSKISISGIISNNSKNIIKGIPIRENIKLFKDYDAVMITNMQDAKKKYDDLLKIIPKEKIILPDIFSNRKSKK